METSPSAPGKEAESEYDERHNRLMGPRKKERQRNRPLAFFFFPGLVPCARFRLRGRTEGRGARPQAESGSSPGGCSGTWADLGWAGPQWFYSGLPMLQQRVRPLYRAAGCRALSRHQEALLAKPFGIIHLTSDVCSWDHDASYMFRLLIARCAEQQGQPDWAGLVASGFRP